MPIAWIRLPDATLPQWHFGSVHMSFVTMFALLTLNDWSSVFYVNYLGCDVFPGSFVSDVPGATIRADPNFIFSDVGSLPVWRPVGPEPCAGPRSELEL